MFHIGYETSFHTWHLAYVAYILWISGLSMFTLFATTREPIEAVAQLRQSKLGMAIGFWIGLSLLAGGFAWPMLVAGPFFIVKMGAPLGAGIVAAGYLIFSLYLNGKLLMERFVPCQQ